MITCDYMQELRMKRSIDEYESLWKVIKTVTSEVLTAEEYETFYASPWGSKNSIDTMNREDVQLAIVKHRLLA